MMKIGVSSYSFLRYLDEGSLDYLGVVAKAKEIGFDGVEYSSLGLPADDPKIIPLAQKIRAAAADAGMPIFSYTIFANFLQKNGWQAEVERLKGEVKVAAELGVPCMRHDSTTKPLEGKDPADEAAFDEVLPILAKGCKAVTEYAADMGVKTMVENHGKFVQEATRCEKLMNAVNHENFGSLIDMGNFLCADDDPVSACKRMAPYVTHFHAKDFHVKPADAADPGEGWFKSRGGKYLRGSIIGHGNVDVPGCIRAVKDAGYDGALSIEFEGLEENYKALSIGLANLRRYVAEA
ncbi:MAG: sugar phosphate isomerase/epimerase [Phycisphaerae bacterium]|nr:sugar phosphate isomerase/epimerase [Phycisphaerae bacterium]